MNINKTLRRFSKGKTYRNTIFMTEYFFYISKIGKGFKK